MVKSHILAIMWTYLNSVDLFLYQLWWLILCVNATGSMVPKYLVRHYLGMSIVMFWDEIEGGDDPLSGQRGNPPGTMLLPFPPSQPQILCLSHPHPGPSYRIRFPCKRWSYRSPLILPLLTEVNLQALWTSLGLPRMIWYLASELGGERLSIFRRDTKGLKDTFAGKNSWPSILRSHHFGGVSPGGEPGQGKGVWESLVHKIWLSSSSKLNLLLQPTEYTRMPDVIFKIKAFTTMTKMKRLLMTCWGLGTPCSVLLIRPLKPGWGRGGGRWDEGGMEAATLAPDSSLQWPLELFSPLTSSVALFRELCYSYSVSTMIYCYLPFYSPPFPMGSFVVVYCFFGL